MLQEHATPPQPQVTSAKNHALTLSLAWPLPAWPGLASTGLATPSALQCLQLPHQPTSLVPLHRPLSLSHTDWVQL